MICRLPLRTIFWPAAKPEMMMKQWLGRSPSRYRWLPASKDLTLCGRSNSAERSAGDSFAHFSSLATTGARGEDCSVSVYTCGSDILRTREAGRVRTEYGVAGNTASIYVDLRELAGLVARSLPAS